MTRFGLAVLFAAIASFAQAAPIFPDGGIIGLVPPPGVTVAMRRPEAGGPSIVVRHMAKDAYAFNVRHPDLAAIGGISARADPFPLGPFPGTVIRGRKTLHGVDYRIWLALVGAPYETASVEAIVPVADTAISDAAIEASLHTIVVRPPGLAARLDALRQEPAVAMALRFLMVVAVCGAFMSIGAWLLGPKPGAGRSAR